MSKNITLKKGFDIKLKGKAELNLLNVDQPETFALKPTDFVGMIRPKALVKEGDTVKAGTPILFDAKQEGVMYTAPVSGEVVGIIRGEKRRLMEVRILADKEIQYVEFPKYTDLASVSKEDAKTAMLSSGVWPQLVQRPYAVVANPSQEPKAVFVSGFDSHPLAPDYEFLFKGQEQYLQAGIDILKKFAPEVHVTTNGKAGSSILAGLNATQHKVSGPHPAGNVGVQIHHINPINKGEVVWTINPFGLLQIGKLFLEGKYDASKLVAVAGSELNKTGYVQTYLGANVKKMVEGNLAQDNVRVISGNVLTGSSIEKDGYVGFYDHVISVLPEGDKPRFFLKDGWLGFITDRLSFHKAWGLLGGASKEYALDTSLNGEERAFVMTGAFEKVVPMDILPTHLIKAIMAKDYDNMEALGLYEVAEEDLALCEFIDVSKHDVQGIIREGIDMLRLS
ncbi:Na(+)-translocating NADH-quinone reductase subunit A [Sediminitomix flava]|uniref:Na(+)-translocating NADH-quinone reductase subunit A n=1 Tax=Sediminitomix flava TaxID=379075 RepID=A0A315ZC11_SEDFL|nr:Na(+)-translocating NADH-quinone reductase subunit A [Sediminitomix flava]PWJ42842.1 Na+-transporting NADH:ubiquinone oxidoreductase subunit A [Sediminitomix flava]